MAQKTEEKDLRGFQQQKTTGVSPWMLSVLNTFNGKQPQSRWNYVIDGFSFDLLEGNQSLWITVRFPDGGRVALRMAYSPEGDLEICQLKNEGNIVEINLNSNIGEYHVRLEIPRPDRPMLRYTTTLVPSAPLRIPYWPRDVLPLGEPDDLIDSEGIVYTQQIGPRSGLVYFSLTRPNGGTALYFQNLTSLNPYAEQTETSLAEVVGGQWPELGLSLPAAKDKPLEAGEEVIISDAFVIFSPDIPPDDLVMARQFLDLLSQVYLCLPPPATEYYDWPDMLEKSLHDLSRSSKCWTKVDGKRFLNAYVGDSENPPESMVQLSVLLPLLEYQEWRGKDIPLVEDLLSGLPKFYDKKAGVYGRWMPSMEDELDESEPQKVPRVMDSWYLYHSLLNLSRLALRGHEPSRKLFLDSVDYAVKVAHKFDYHWPVFYNMDTLKVLKAETEPGQGGELDVPGLYAHVMMQAWDLTKEKRFLEEAKKAVRSLEGLGFNLLYQTNSTVFASGAMLRLWQETGDELYLNLSYLCLANVFNHVWLWDCDYGYGKHYPTYFALFPLKRAPYTAVYEELEGLAALHDYLSRSDHNVPESVKILTAEFIRVLLYKASFYYPPNLPKEILTEKPRTGEIVHDMWIPLEDIHDGWEKPGEVGQEVYGAGLPFGLVSRHYTKIPGEKMLIYINYPTSKINAGDKQQITFHVGGSHQFRCQMRLIPMGKRPLAEYEVIVEHEGKTRKLKALRTPEGHLEYDMEGDQKVTIRLPGVKSKARKTNTNGKKEG